MNLRRVLGLAVVAGICHLALAGSVHAQDAATAVVEAAAPVAATSTAGRGWRACAPRSNQSTTAGRMVTLVAGWAKMRAAVSLTNTGVRAL